MHILRRERRIDQQLHYRPTATCSAIPDTNATGQNSTSSTNSTCTAATDCSTLSSTYTAFSDTQFEIHCNTDYTSTAKNLLAVYVIQFEDCINACASYNMGSDHPNSSCLIVSYNLGIPRGTVLHQDGNCFLKGRAGIPAVTNENTSSAVLVTS